jgi:hypothetical protein
MRRTATRIAPCVLGAALLLPSASPAAPLRLRQAHPLATTTAFTTKGRTIEIDDGSGAKPFFMKGLDYSPAPICSGPLDNPLGRQNGAIWRRDLPQLRAIGANSIKVYNVNVTINDPLDEYLAAAYNNGNKPIYTILSIFFPGNVPLNAGAVADVAGQYKRMAQTYGTSPDVIGISIGSEINSDAYVNNPAWWAGLKQIAQGARDGLRLAGAKKIITTSLVDDGLKTVRLGEKNGFNPDAWGVNVYRGPSFQRANLWTDVASSTSKPFMLGEWGAPESYHPNGDPNVAKEWPKDQVSTMTDYLTGLEGDSYANSTLNNGPSSGGFLFEWNDEWWKSGLPGANCKQLPNGVPNHSFPGGFSDEAWYGLNSIGTGTPNVLTQRPAFAAMAQTWGMEPTP